MSTLDYQGGEVLAALESQFVPKLVAKPKPEIRIKDAIVCSFFTSDDYYKSHGSRLRANLEELGIEVDLREITKKEGEDWAAICRKKVGFIAEVCAANPDKKVFWIDVDCELFSIPDFILNSTADIIGFQRGFSNPTKIGYEISFNKYFYRHKPLRELEEVSNDILKLEDLSDGLIREILNLA